MNTYKSNLGVLGSHECVTSVAAHLSLCCLSLRICPTPLIIICSWLRRRPTSICTTTGHRRMDTYLRHRYQWMYGCLVRERDHIANLRRAREHWLRTFTLAHRFYDHTVEDREEHVAQRNADFPYIDWDDAPDQLHTFLIVRTLGLVLLDLALAIIWERVICSASERAQLDWRLHLPMPR